MRKHLLLAGVAGLAFGAFVGASTAVADVTVFATITKDKTVTVSESVTIDKTVDLDATVNSFPSKFAEANALANQRNSDDRACENCAEKMDTLSGSVIRNNGITSVNQAAGNLNNQGSALAAAVDADQTTNPNDGFAEADASAQQINGGMSETPKSAAVVTGSPDTIDTVNILFRTALITGSINNNAGATFVNQAVGNINNQANLVSIAFSERAGGVALSESDLGQFNIADTVGESGSQDAGDGAAPGCIFCITKTATISSSVNGNTGIVGVNQGAGNFANQANIFSLAATMPAGTR